MFEVFAIRTVRSSSEPPVRGSIERREAVEQLGHLVAAFSAADVHHDVGARPAGEDLLDDRLAGTEAARDDGRAALGDREEHVDHALAR